MKKVFTLFPDGIRGRPRQTYRIAQPMGSAELSEIRKGPTPPVDYSFARISFNRATCAAAALD